MTQTSTTDNRGRRVRRAVRRSVVLRLASPTPPGAVPTPAAQRREPDASTYDEFGHTPWPTQQKQIWSATERSPMYRLCRVARASHPL